MIELQVTETVVDLTTINSLNTTGIEVQLTAGQIIPAVELGIGVQGPEGAKGEKGDKGDKGDALVYSSLTPEERNEVIAQFDSTIGTTSYANLFLNTYLS